MKPWEPRFSLRTLAIAVTMVCAYFAVWEATKKWGAREGTEVIHRLDGGILKSRPRAYSPMPFIVLGEEEVSVMHSPDTGHTIVRPAYFLWLFGPTIKLPFKAEWKWDHSDS